MYKMKEGFKLHKIGGDFVVVAFGIQNVDFCKVINLNETSAYLWENIIGKEFDAEMLCTLLLEEYEVEKEVSDLYSINY